jgi:mercuric reductase
VDETALNEHIELDVRGMTCTDCAQHVTRALLTLPGVVDVDVPGWQSGRASVVAQPGMDDDRLTAAVAGAGYHARVVAHRSATTGGADEDETQPDFDLLVIGAGSGGFAAAIRGVELGFRVGLVGSGALGGTCVNVGCVPSKALIRAAEVWHCAGHHPFPGVTTGQVQLDWEAVRQQKDGLVAALRQEKYADVLAAYPDITFIPGQAQFRADGSLVVTGKSYRARSYVIATGARPRLLPIPGAQETNVLTSTTVMDLPALPQSMIVVGGRAVALELGQTMARFGVQVVILQRSPRLIPEHEPELATALRGYLEEEGLDVVTGVQVERIEREGNLRAVHVQVEGHPQVYRAQQVLMAVGRQPNMADLGLEAVGVRTDSHGAIIVDDRMRTSAAHIYATGDCTTNPEFVYVAAAGGAVAAENALTGAGRVLDLSAMPAVIFTDPQVATVGLTEATANAQGRQVKTSTLPLHYLARARTARDTRGLIKLVADGDTGRLLGAHVLAAEGSEVIQSAVLAIRFGLTLDDLTSTLFPYLTIGEGLKLTAQTFSKDPAKLSCCAA